MAMRGARVCKCGKTVAAGARCICQQKDDRERKARFDAKRPSSRERGYNAEWQKARSDYLKVYSSCVRCGSAATVVDHRTPHKGNDQLFWDRSNWQALCTPCHSGAKQSEERRQQKKVQ